MFLGIRNGLDPAEWALIKRRRSVFLIGIFRSSCVYAVVSRAEKAEDEEEKTSDDKGVYDGGVDGALLDL